MAGGALLGIGPLIGLPMGYAGAALTAIAALAIVSLAQAEPSWHRPVPRWLVALGEWSFALYLTHLLLISFLYRLGLNGWPMVAIAVPSAIALSALAYLLWERPAEAWLRRRRVGERNRDLVRVPAVLH